MQAPIEVSRRVSGKVFLLDILSHRMSAIAIYRQLTRLPSSWRLGLLPVCRQTIQNRRIRVRRAAQAIIARTYGTRPWHETRPL